VKHRTPQLKLFALDEALGEGEWLRVGSVSQPTIVSYIRRP
jgi:hypothetical protein